MPRMDLLTPTVDHLFDKGFISFENGGDLVVSAGVDGPSILKDGHFAESKNKCGQLSEGQKRFLEYHRDNVLRMSHRRGRPVADLSR